LVETLTLLLIGGVAGFLSSLLGIGGGVILIPLLIYVGHIQILVATSVSVVAIIFASSAGTVAHYGRGNVHIATGIWMGVASIASALGGALLSGYFPDALLYYLYMGIVTAAIIMLFLPRLRQTPNPREFHLRRLPAVLTGLFKGFMTGVLGIGGGFILVPLMIYFLDMPIHKAMGTSLAVNLFTAAAGFVGKLATGNYDLRVIFWVVLGIIPATQAGAWAANKSSPRSLRLFLVALLMVILVKMAWSVFLQPQGQ